jgi:hypothetical protein
MAEMKTKIKIKVRKLDKLETTSKTCWEES